MLHYRGCGNLIKHFIQALLKSYLYQLNDLIADHPIPRQAFILVFHI